MANCSQVYGTVAWRSMMDPSSMVISMCILGNLKGSSRLTSLTDEKRVNLELAGNFMYLSSTC